MEDFLLYVCACVVHTKEKKRAYEEIIGLCFKYVFDASPAVAADLFKRRWEGDGGGCG